jgi:hypothetical protein
MALIKIIWDANRNLYQLRNPKTGKKEWCSWEELQRWQAYVRYVEHPDEIELIRPWERERVSWERQHLIRSRIEPLGTDMSRTSEETARPQDRRRFRKWRTSLIKADSRNSRAKNYNYFMQTTLLKHPKMFSWFNDPTVPTIVKEEVKRYYGVLLGSLKGKRPEYVLSVLIAIATDQHTLNYDPQCGFVENYNADTWKTYYNEFLLKLSQKLHTFRRPDGSRGRFEWKQKR